MSAILISGFPYIRKVYFETFDEYPEKNDLLFLLPDVWKIKNGKVVFYPPKDPRVITARAFFHHSHYPLIGGLLKGWMPAFLSVLWTRRREVKLVYSCSEPILLTTLYQALITKALGKKHVMFSWENIPFSKKFSGLNWLLKKMILKANLALSDGMICGNTKGKRIYQAYTDKPIEIIPMSGVDGSFLSRQPGKNFQGADWTGKTVFTFAGAIGYRKGVHLIIEAFEELKKDLPNAHLAVAGSGEYDDAISELIGQSGISESVTRIPWLDRPMLRELLNASDVFVYPSLSHGGWEEQFGYSMVEASLMELPVITTRSGSIEDVVKDGKTGIIIEPNDISQMKDAMLALGKDPELRERLGRAGRTFALEQFSHRTIAGKFHDFFSRILKRYE